MLSRRLSSQPVLILMMQSFRTRLVVSMLSKPYWLLEGFRGVSWTPIALRVRIRTFGKQCAVLGMFLLRQWLSPMGREGRK